MCILWLIEKHLFRDIYYGHSPPPKKKLKNREEFEGLREKRKGKGEKRRRKKRVIKQPLKYRYEA